VLLGSYKVSKGVDSSTTSDPCFLSPERAEPSTLSSLSFFVTSWKFRLLVSRSYLWKSNIGSCWAFLCFPDVIPVLSSTLLCRSWLSFPSSEIAAVCGLISLLQGRLVAAVLRPLFLMALLHSGPFQLLFPYVRPFRVSCTTLSWSYILRSCPLRRTTFVLRDILLPAAANSFRVTATQPVHWRVGCCLGKTHNLTATYCCGDVIAPARKCVYEAVT
jgi:hypothetical protein